MLIVSSISFLFLFQDANQQRRFRHSYKNFDTTINSPLHLLNPYKNFNKPTRYRLFSKNPETYYEQNEDAICKFTTEVENSLQINNVNEKNGKITPNDSRDFVSFRLLGPKAMRKNKNRSKASEVQQELLNGHIREVRGRLILLGNKKRQTRNVKSKEIDKGQLYIHSSFKYHRKTDIAQNWLVRNGEKDAISIKQRLISLFNLSAQNIEGLAFEREMNDTHRVSHTLGLQSGELVTSSGKWKLTLSKGNKAGASCVFVKNKDTVNSLIPFAHDKDKNFLVKKSSSFFQELGVVNAEGKPRPGMSSKLKQCQRFVETVSVLVERYLRASSFMQNDDEDIIIKTNKPMIKMMDFACGRAYLTFALHSYLTDQYSNKFEVHSRGVDRWPKLVKEINGIARNLGEDFQHLKFVEGAIEDTMLSVCETTPSDPIIFDEVASNENSLNILIALHACDTATDDSIWYGIKQGTEIIVTAPCCHKQVRQFLDPHLKTMKSDHPFADLLRHNIYKERIAETITDSMRALLLEIANYDVQIFEFIEGEHTDKNVMITAVRRKKPRSEEDISELRKRLISLASLNGISRHKLADWMGESLIQQETSNKFQNLSQNRMPPI